VKIAVCIKQVPDTEAKIRIGADGKTIDSTGVNFVLNPYDEFAVEEALQIKERLGAGEITVLSLGPERVTAAIRTALAMGADNAVHLKIDDANLDSHTVAVLLSQVLKERAFDLVLLGKQAVDDDSAQVGPRLATLLDIPCVSVVTKLTINENKIVAEREVEGGVEVVEAQLPAVITCQKGLNEPRYAALKGIMLAKKKPIEEIVPATTEAKLVIQKMEYPPSRKAGKIVGTGIDAVPELVRLLHEEAKII